MKKEMQKLVTLETYHSDGKNHYFVPIILYLDPQLKKEPYEMVEKMYLQGLGQLLKFESSFDDSKFHWALLIRHWIEEVKPELLKELRVGDSDKGISFRYEDRNAESKLEDLANTAESCYRLQQLADVVNDFIRRPKDAFQIISKHEDEFSLRHEEVDDPYWKGKRW